MGNQLTGIAPSQILPVEQYLTDVPQFHFVEKYVLCFVQYIYSFDTTSRLCVNNNISSSSNTNI